MDAARQLRSDTIPFVPRAVPPSTALPLQISTNPFVAGASGTRMGRPLQKAFGEVIRHIGLQTSIIAVVGSAGTGKSLLVDMTARACADMGLTVRRIDRGDQVHTLLGTKSDVLLIDQTDSMSSSSLQTLLSPEGKNTTTTMVFMCLPTCVGQIGFSGGDRASIELTPLSLSDARNYLHERAASIGRTNLFSPEALDLVIDGSRGLPRLLRSIAHLAYWAAASEGAPQIGAQHVSNASGSQGIEPVKITADDSTQQVTPNDEGTEPGAKTQLGFGIGTKENDRPIRTSERVADGSDPRAVNNSANERDNGVAGALAHAIAVGSQRQQAVKKTTPADPVKEIPGLERRSAEIWMPRIAGALAASVAIGAVMSFTLMGGKPVAVPHAARAPSAVTIPDRSKATVASTPAPVTNNTVAVVPPPKVVPRKDSPVANPGNTKAAVQTTRENPATEQSAVLKPADDKSGSETERTNGIVAAGDQIPNVARETEKAARGNDASEQTAAALKATQEQAAEAQAAMAREKTAVQAFLLAQEAGRRAQAARETAAREQAAKEAAERSRVARQTANRQFSNSLLGVGR